MDVVLLGGIVDNLHLNYRPFGIHQLAWHLRKHGYQTQVINFIQHAPEKLLKEALAKYITPSTKIVGLGLMASPSELQTVFKKVESVLRWVKRTYPGLKVIAGGPLTSELVRMYRNQTLFDYLFYGHAENTLLELCEHLTSGHSHPKVADIQGNVVIREVDADPSRIRFNIEQSSFEWAENDFVQEGETLPLELGRGCMFACRFCSYPYIGKKVNDFNRSMKCIEEELRRNYEKWKITSYLMLDDTINASHERCLAFHKLTQSLPFRIQFAGYCRMDLLATRPDSEQILFEAGLRGVYFGLETMNQAAADLIKKSWNAREAREYLPKLQHELWRGRVGIQVGMIAGLPPETLPELKETNKWLIGSGVNMWKWHPLGINRNRNSLFISEFDRNAESYGFEWYVDNGKLSWKTKYATRRDAEEWSSQLMSEAAPHFKYACWALLELAQYGLKVEDMVKVPSKKNEFRLEISSRRKEFLLNYWHQLLNRKVNAIEFVA